MRLRGTRRWRRCFRQHGPRRVCLCPRRPRRILQSISGSPTAASGTRAVRRSRSGRRRIPVLAAVAFCAMTGGAYAAGVDRRRIVDRVGGPRSHRRRLARGRAHPAAGPRRHPRPPSRGRHRRRQPRGRPRTPPWAPRTERHTTTGTRAPTGRATARGMAPTSRSWPTRRTPRVSTRAPRSRRPRAAARATRASTATGTAGAIPATPIIRSHPSHPSHPDHPSGGNGGGDSHKPGS